MEDDKILAAVQNDAPRDEYETKTSDNALKIGVAVGLFCMAAMFVTEWFVLQTYDFGKPFLIMLIAGIADLIEGRRLHKRYMIVKCVIEFALAIFFLLAYTTILMGVVK